MKTEVRVEEKHRRTPKTEKLLKKVLGHRFTCERSQADLELLCSIYKVMNVGAESVRLWDIVGKQEARCWNSSGYPGRKGEVWYIWLVPPFVGGFNRR